MEASELDVAAVRAFLAVVEEGHFGEAAAVLGLSQQAVSKRVARLEERLGAELVHRDRNGVRPSAAGERFLPHARALLSVAERAVEAVTGTQRPLRVDVISHQIIATELLHAFHERHPDIEIDLVTGFRSVRSRDAALADGRVDAAFAFAADGPFERVPAYQEVAHLLVGRRHRFARRKRVRPAELRGATAWMPGNRPGAEWTGYWHWFGREFGIGMDTSGPDLGIDYLLDWLSTSPEGLSFAGDGVRVPWHEGIVRIPLADPVPVYPCSLLWRTGNAHPGLATLAGFVREHYRPLDRESVLLPPDSAAQAAG
ncbi:LysR family transcriptional regulator [Sciscionella sediminilitoris]|uniref:LysR family transcriptional regulator n=1 Tax=Sciscionella sediminilitoris TaxID=1445613 RepID=UPI0004DEF25F|nr:LysR family transcriptional regulator [Sciscionella sp. SE31]